LDDYMMCIMLITIQDMNQVFFRRRGSCGFPVFGLVAAALWGVCMPSYGPCMGAFILLDK